jgi:hypothetical protein
LLEGSPKKPKKNRRAAVLHLEIIGRPAFYTLLPDIPVKNQKLTNIHALSKSCSSIDENKTRVKEGDSQPGSASLLFTDFLRVVTISLMSHFIGISPLIMEV